MVALLAACGGNSGSQENAGDADQAAQAEQAGQEDKAEKETEMDTKHAKLLYMGHASIRITTPEDKVIYIDPYVGDSDDYTPTADLILETHRHPDHIALNKIENRSEDCQIITWKEALEGGALQSFDLGYVNSTVLSAIWLYSPHNSVNALGRILRAQGNLAWKRRLQFFSVWKEKA